MSERRAFTLFFIGVFVVTITLGVVLNLLRPDPEVRGTAYMLLVSATGLGGGFLFMRYH